MGVTNEDSGDRLSIPAAARHVGVSKHTMRAWLRARRLPFYRVGRRIVLSRTDVDAFMARSRIEAEVRA